MSHKKEILYDIRVVRMAKSTKSADLSTILEKMDDIRKERDVKGLPSNLNLCLGHFDVMMIDWINYYGKPSKNPMHEVIKDYNNTLDLAGMLNLKSKKNPGWNPVSEKGNYFPIYMLLQNDNSDGNTPDDLDTFWKMNSNYTIIMRLHQASSQSDGDELFRNMLKNRLRDVDQFSNCPIKLKSVTPSELCFTMNVSISQTVTREVTCVFYDSLELGDVVGVMRGASLRAILEVQRWLYEATFVSDAYSYCGISYNLLNNSKLEPDREKELKESILDYVETRFSVKSSDLAWNFLNGLVDKGFFVTGNADGLLHYSNITEYDLLKNLTNIICYNAKNPYKQFESIDIYDLFHDVVTRIGIENRAPIRKNGESAIAPFRPKTIRLEQGLVDWLSGEYERNNHPDGQIYANSLEKLVSSLNAMHSNSVTDALSQLMYDGIDALIEQLEYYWEKCRRGGIRSEWDRVSTYVLETLQEFLDEWSSVTNEILHLESQLFQHPELIPVRYYIPAMILQFQRLIVLKAMQSVHSFEKNKRYTYVPIILPRSQRQTNTKAILDPKEDANYDKRSPLCIYIPIHMLYHPYRVSLILCHEIAHYCGHEIRHRELRIQTVLNCMSFYAATRMIQSLDLLSADSNDNRKIIDKYETCTEIVKRQLRHIVTDKLKNGFLDDVIAEFQENIPRLIQDPRLINEIVRALLQGFDSADDQLRICDSIQMDGYKTLLSDAEICKNHLKYCLDNLLRECFADIVMILLTECSFEDYYLRLFHDEYENLTKQGYSNAFVRDTELNEWYERHTDRMALVACCINDILKDSLGKKWCDETCDGNKDWRYFYAVIRKVKKWEAEVNSNAKPKIWPREYGDPNKDCYLLMGYEAERVIEYLNQCAHDISAKINPPYESTSKPVKELRRRIALMKTNQMNWDELQKILRTEN